MSLIYSLTLAVIQHALSCEGWQVRIYLGQESGSTEIEDLARPPCNGSTFIQVKYMAGF